MEGVSHDERLVRVMGLDDDLRHAPKGVTPDDSECDRTQGSRLVENAEVRHGNGDNVSLRNDDVLRMDCPYAGVREVKRALGLTLIDPLEVAHKVRVVRTGRRHGEHSDQSRSRTGQDIDDDIERSI